MKTQEEVAAAFFEAIGKEDVTTARDLVTLLYPGPEKTAAYKLIVATAIEIGDCNRMLETAPFAGYQPTEEDFEQCLAAALKSGNTYYISECRQYVEK